MAEDRPIIYVLDEADCVVGWNDAFTDFADENGLDLGDLRAGKSLWEYIEGSQAQQLHHWLIANARRRPGGVRYRYRCDSPDTYRLFEMEVSPVEAGGIVLSSSTVETRPLRETDLGKPPFLTICAWCNRISQPQGWIALDAATIGLDAGDPRAERAITHGICAECAASFVADEAPAAGA